MLKETIYRVTEYKARNVEKSSLFDYAINFNFFLHVFDVEKAVSTDVQEEW